MIRNRAARGGVSWRPCFAVAALAVTLPVRPALAQGPVVSEISISPPRGHPQFIEIENPSTERIDLAGWRISGTSEHSFPAGASIDPLGFLVLATDAGEFEAAHGFAPDGEFPGFFIEDEAALVLTSVSGAVECRAVHRLDAGSLARGGGATLELVAPELDGTDASSWAPSRMVGGTPGAENSRRRRFAVDPVIPRGETWRYWKGTAPPPGDPLAWTRPDYDDGSWPGGPAPIGSGNLDDATPLDDMRGAYTTVYVRRTFEARVAGGPAGALLWVVYDDGFIAHVNGREVLRRNMGGPGTPRPHDAAADARQENEGIPEEHHLALEPGVLVEGRNVLAIQAANDHIRGSDFSIHAALTIAAHAGGEEPPRLVLNEAWLEPSGGAENGVVVEVFNAGAAETALDGFRLISGRSGRAIDFPPDAILVPGGFFTLAAPLDVLAGKTILARAEGGLIADAADLGAAAAGGSCGRFPDGGRAVVRLPSPTPAAPNAAPVPGEAAITEIHYHPLDPDEEFIEIRAARDLDLGGWAVAGGIRFGFPAGTTLEAGGYLAVARSPDLLRRHHGPIHALGPFQGRLDNAADELILLDARGLEVDRVRYADDGSWPVEADGSGPALEVIDPGRANDEGAAWKPSPAPGGSPGRPNGAAREAAPPLITGVRHVPLVPRPGETVMVSARIEPPGSSADLLWRLDGDAAFTRVPMAEARGLRTAAVLAPSEGSIVEYAIEAKLPPGEGPGDVSVYPAAPPGTCLFLVDAKAASPLVESYRLLLRAGDLARLDADVASDDFVPATFIAGGEAFHDARARYRGSGSRSVLPRSYHVRFTDDHPFEGETRVFLNGFRPERQVLAMDLWRRAGMPSSRARLVQLSVNGVVAPRHARMEPIDEDYLARHFGNADGNLYRGRETADLSYLGSKPKAYEALYEKRTNEEARDWSDIIDLVRAFAVPDDDAFAEQISRLIDPEEWARYFAVNAVLSNQEGGIHRDTGDDYYIYRPPRGRFVLLPWDMDSTFLEPAEPIFRPTIPAIRRFLTHPRFAPLYHRELRRAIAGPFRPPAIAAAAALLEASAPEAVDGLLTFARERSAFLEQSLPSRLTAGIARGGWGTGEDLHAAERTILLAGSAPAADTHRVLVNGFRAEYVPWTGAWARDVDLPGREARVRVAAIDALGRTIAEREAVIRALDDPRPITSLPAGRTTWTRDGSPHILAASIDVETGSELIVEEGAGVLAPEGAAIVVRGSLKVAGTAGRRVSFAPAATGGPWAGIRVEPGGSAEIVHADFKGEAAVVPAIARPALISVERAAVTVRSSTFHRIPGAAIEVVEGSAEVTDCEFLSTMEAIHGVRSTVVAARNLVDRTLGDSDGIDLDEDPLPGRPGSRIEENTVLRAGDDGIDLLRSSALIHGNVIVSAGDRGISIEGAGSPLVEGNIVSACRDGIALKDGTVASGHHNTVTGSITGLRAFRKEPGAPGARGSFHSSIIWGNGADAAIESGSVLALDHSDVGIDPASWGPANFSADPLLDPGGGFLLLAGSPCAAAGRDGSPVGARGLAEGGPPEIVSVEPASGPAGGGNRVTITGRSLDGMIEARIGGRPLAGAVALATGAIRGTAPPAGRAGAAGVEVETAAGTALLPGGYRYVLRLLKGDADGDLRLSVTDAVLVLRGLFAGGGLPPCPAALDLTGDARADIADALFLLEYLFAGGPQPDTILVDCE